MAKIIVNNPKQVINGGAKKYYFKVKGLGGLKGDKGDTGAQGIQGIQGLSATVRIGTTTTGEPGTQASVRNSGTESNAVLDFTIPRGDVGPQPELVQTIGTSTTKAMSQNATTEALNNISGTKQDKLTAGDNIKIENGVISSTDTTYTAGNGLNLNGTEFSADTTVLATKEDLEGYYTKTETDNLLAPKLEAEVVPELPATGEDGKLYLTPKAHTTQTATGNPITATVTEEVGKIESFQLDGDTTQTTYSGKNMIGFQTGNFSKEGLTFNFAADGTITIDGTKDNTGASYYNGGSLFNFIEGSFTLTLIPISGSFGGANIGYRAYKTDTEQAWFQVVNSAGSYDQATLNRTAEEIGEVAGIQFLIGSGSVSFNNFKFKLQVTAGSDHDTNFEPYVGGIPSPNPDYPQPIQTVTGTQTISINGTNYPLYLGSIELCKLGEYHDYIWKDGEDWKIHKAVGKAELWKGTNWRRLNTNKNGEFRFSVKVSNTDTPTSGSSTTFVLLNSNYWTACTRMQTYERTQGIAATGTSDFSVESFVAFVDSLKTSDVDEWKAWLTANMPVLYYQSTTPTDTTITDQTLIEQLETIRTASLQNGANTITNIATGTNLAGDMEIGYYGYNPRNRYDKWLWLDINNEYEQIGS